MKTTDLIVLAKEYDSFALVVRFGTCWEKQIVLCEFAEGSKPEEFPELGILTSIAVAQEWANRLGQKVQLGISGHHPETGNGVAGVCDLNPCDDGRKPEGIPQPTKFIFRDGEEVSEVVILNLAEMQPTAFWPVMCAGCFREESKQLTAEHLCVTSTRNGFVTYVPLCWDHLSADMTDQEKLEYGFSGPEGPPPTGPIQ